MGVKITQQGAVPCLDASSLKRYAQEEKEAGLYDYMTASPLMSGLYGARSCRPDEIIAAITKSWRINTWTKLDDRKLVRYLSC